MAKFENCIDKVLKSEGGYVNDPDDAGGETKFGISKKAYPSVDIKNLTLDDAKAIYKKDYWDKIKGDEIADDSVAYEIFDTAVNMGTRASSKLAQTVANSTPDGIIGANTLIDINNIDTELFITKFRLAKISRYVSLVKKTPTNKKYLLGWITRALGE